jgi:hypothetical protein
MEAGLQRLADQAAVCDTLYRFAAGIDQRDWRLYRSVFTDEIELDYGSYRAENVGPTAADAWVDRARLLFTGLDASQHSLYNPRVSVDGDTASCEIYVQAEHFLHNSEGDDWWSLGGWYSDRLVRAGDGWKIRGKKLTVAWSRGNRGIMALAVVRGAERLKDPSSGRPPG